MAQHPVSGAAAQYGEFLGAAEARALSTPTRSRARFRIPPSNRWILDEVALWLTLGHVPGLRVADFDRADVAENGEFAGTDPAGPSLGRVPLLLPERAPHRRVAEGPIHGGLSLRRSHGRKPSSRRRSTEAAEARRADRSDFPDRIFANASPHSVGGVSMFEPGVLADADTVANFVSDPTSSCARSPARRRRVRGPPGHP